MSVQEGGSMLRVNQLCSQIRANLSASSFPDSQQKRTPGVDAESFTAAVIVVDSTELSVLIDIQSSHCRILAEKAHD